MLVEIKILNERLQFIKIMTEAKTLEGKNEKKLLYSQQNSIVNIMDSSLSSQQFQDLQSQIGKYQE